MHPVSLARGHLIAGHRNGMLAIRLALLGASAPGMIAPTFAIAPTVLYHAGDSTIITAGAEAAFTASVASGSASLVVSAIASGTIAMGAVIVHPQLPDGTRIKAGPVGGGPGTYTLTQASYGAIASGPMTCSAANLVTGVSDLRGVANLVSPDGYGPQLMTDALGRRFLRFAVWDGLQGAWLQSLTGITGLDTYNATWMAVMRVHSPYRQTLVSHGTRGNSPAGGTFGALAIDGGNNVVPAAPIVSGVRQGLTTASPNINRMLAGSQLQLVGSSICTSAADGLNGAATSGAQRLYHNTVVATATATSGRYRNIAGIEVGRFAPGSGSTSQYVMIDLYMLAGWTTGQFFSATQAAAADAIAQTIVDHYAIPPVTRSLILGGDSRVEQNQLNGITTAEIISRPGGASALPPDWRVINLGFSGKGHQTQYNALSNSNSVYGAALMLGGGADVVALHQGVNDYSGASGWPTDNTAVSTVARANEIYSGGSGLDRTVVGSISGSTLTVESGTPRIGAAIIGSGIPSGTVVNSGSGTTWTLSTGGTTVAAGTTMTQPFADTRRLVGGLLARGFRVVQAAEVRGSGEGAATSNLDTLRNHIRTDLAIDTGADSGGIYEGRLRIADFEAITLGGVTVFGRGANWSVPAGVYDGGVHPRDAARPWLVSGADTPAQGILSNALQVIAPTITNDIASTRGADTKASAGGVNLGALLAVPMAATTSAYTLVSGSTGHWNLPTNGTHPTPNATGVAARLGGGPYVFDYTISDGTRTVSARLTITRDLGRSLAAYDYISKDGGRTAVAAETFTTACYTVSTTAEYNALTAANRAGATILVARGVTGTVDLSMFGLTPANPCLVQSEDIARPSIVSRVVCNTGGKHRFDSLRILMTKTAATAAFGNANVLRTTGNTSDIRISNIIVGAPAGTAKTDYPSISLEQATDMHLRNSRLVRYLTMSVRYQTRPIFKSLRCQYFNVDAFFFGNANNEVWTDGVFEDIIGSEPHWVTGDQNHPDAGQFFTTASAGQGIQLTGTMVMADVRFYGGAGDLSYNGFAFTGSGSGFPKMQGTIKMFGLAHSSLTSYAAGHLGNADYSASIATEMYGQTAVRQLTGVTGSISAGKGSGAQGFDTWSDDGLTPSPSTNQRYPGHKQTAPWPTGCNLKVIDSYFDGEPPTTVGTMDISKATYKNKLPSATDPVGLTPAQINDNIAYFDDPNRVVDWSGMSPEQIDAIYADMYATKAGGPLDNGDGTVRGHWCVRRAGAKAKVNQIGRATLAVAHAAGTVTVTLSAVLAVDVICDIRQGASNGALLATVVIPAGQTTAAAPLAIAPGTTIVAANDSGLLNPSVVA